MDTLIDFCVFSRVRVCTQKACKSSNFIIWVYLSDYLCLTKSRRNPYSKIKTMVIHCRSIKPQDILPRIHLIHGWKIIKIIEKYEKRINLVTIGLHITQCFVLSFFRMHKINSIEIKTRSINDINEPLSSIRL